MHSVIFLSFYVRMTLSSWIRDYPTSTNFGFEMQRSCSKFGRR